MACSPTSFFTVVLMVFLIDPWAFPPLECFTNFVKGLNNPAWTPVCQRQCRRGHPARQDAQGFLCNKKFSNLQSKRQLQHCRTQNWSKRALKSMSGACTRAANNENMGKIDAKLAAHACTQVWQNAPQSACPPCHTSAATLRLQRACPIA